VIRSVLVVLLLVLPAAAAAQQEPPASAPTRVDISRGGLTISSGVNSLTIGARFQFRWTVEDREKWNSDSTGAGRGEDDGPLSQFDVPRMRVTLRGGVFRPWLRYDFQFDFSRTSGEASSKIKDALIEIRPPDRPFHLSLGQFKAPFGLQQLTSSGRLQFVDRAITDAKFNPSRDTGVMLSGTFAGRRGGYHAGVFNGSGEAVRQNTRAPLWVGRVFVQPLGAYALSEGSSDAGERTVVHLGAAARTGKQIRGRTAAGVVEDADNETAVSLEFALKGARFYSTAEHFWMTNERENPVVAPDVRSRGFHAQAGYMLVPRRLEAGVLYARITPDTTIDGAAVTELRAVAGYYWHAHGLKLQADAGTVGFGANFTRLPATARLGLPSLGPRLVSGRSLHDRQLRVQMQVAF